MIEESADPSYHSTTYGINNRCALNTLKYFHVCNYGLPPDLLEGYVPYAMKLMLRKIFDQKLLTLEQLNNRIIHFNYGSDARNKPNILTCKVLSSEDHGLSQNGMCIIYFMHC